MRKALAILAVVGFVGSVGVAEQVPADRTLVGLVQNTLDLEIQATPNGLDSNMRVAKWSQNTLVSEWDQGAIEEIKNLMSIPPPPGQVMEVRIGMTGNSWDTAAPGWVAWFDAFQADQDWNDMEATHTEASLGVSWTTGAVVTNFYALPGVPNSVPVVGYVNTAGPGDPYPTQQTITAVLDQAPGGLLDTLLNDPTCRGLRFWGNADQNQAVYDMTQWGTGFGPAIMVYTYPEPATMLLIAVGGVGLLLRKRR